MIGFTFDVRISVTVTSGNVFATQVPTTLYRTSSLSAFEHRGIVPNTSTPCLVFLIFAPRIYLPSIFTTPIVSRLSQTNGRNSTIFKSLNVNQPSPSTSPSPSPDPAPGDERTEPSITKQFSISSTEILSFDTYSKSG